MSKKRKRSGTEAKIGEKEGTISEAEAKVEARDNTVSETDAEVEAQDEANIKAVVDTRTRDEVNIEADTDSPPAQGTETEPTTDTETQGGITDEIDSAEIEVDSADIEVDSADIEVDSAELDLDDKPKGNIFKRTVLNRSWWKQYGLSVALFATIAVSSLAFGIAYWCEQESLDLVTKIKQDIRPTQSCTADPEASKAPVIGFDGSVIDDTSLPENVELNEFKYALLRVDFNKLKKKYPNAVGWLTIPNTNIEYAITQYQDNEYYLNHDIKGNVINSGWVFADYRMSETVPMRNYLIYGHNMRNGASFGNLKYYISDPEWISNPENQYIYFSTEYYTAAYQIFNVMKVKSTEVYYHNRELNNNTMIDYLNEMTSHNMLKDKLTYASPFRADDRIITLSTCNDSQGYEKYVVQGMLVHYEVLKTPDAVLQVD